MVKLVKFSSRRSVLGALLAGVTGLTGCAGTTLAQATSQTASNAGGTSSTAGASATTSGSRAGAAAVSSAAGSSTGAASAAGAPAIALANAPRGSGGPGGPRGRGPGGAGGFAVITAVNGNTLTLRYANGTSQQVTLASGATITKVVAASANDLKAGELVTPTYSAGSNGNSSISALRIQTPSSQTS